MAVRKRPEELKPDIHATRQSLFAKHSQRPATTNEQRIHSWLPKYLESTNASMEFSNFTHTSRKWGFGARGD
jgi:hypothetical protein